MIYLLTKDLFFVPQVQSAAQALGLDVVVGRSSDDERLFPKSGSGAIAFIVDLGSISLQDVDELTRRVRETHPHSRMVAFGSHVHETRLARARAAGFDHVVTKGQFSRGLPSLIQTWLGQGSD